MHLSMDKNLPKMALKEFYDKKAIEKYDGHFDELYHAVRNSDYIVTAWEEDKIIGIIRSAGDHIFSQYITNFLIDEEYSSKGIGSKMLDAYLEEAEEVMDVYIITGRKITKSFTLNWFNYKGFHQVVAKDDLQMFKRTHIPEE